MSWRSRSLPKMLVALLLLVETMGRTANRKQDFLDETIQDDEDAEGAASTLPLQRVASESSSWQPRFQRLRNQQRLMLSRLLVPQVPLHHGDRYPEMEVAEAETARRRLSPVIFRVAVGESDGESIRPRSTRPRQFPFGQSQVGPP